MKGALFKILTISMILLIILNVGHCSPSESHEILLADNYTALADDIKWFFRGVKKIAGTLEQLLPNVTSDVVETRSFSEHTRITLLMGLRHLLVGVREISMTFEQSFRTDHVEQLHQLKNLTNFINDVVGVIKIWFSQMRALVLQLLQLYNRYIPEVLFGKCLSNYLVTTYPEHSYYEYPIILLTQIYSSIVTTASSETEPIESSTELPIFNTDLNIEQNEISHTDLDDYGTPYGKKSSRHLATASTESISNIESFFDFSTVLNENRDKVIESAVNQQSWQICFKLYTAESISRSLKIFFLGL